MLVPSGVRTFPIGEQLTVDGTPMRLQGFVSAESPARLAAQFRKSLGSPLVESVNARGLVLGRALGRHYLTVQFVPADSGTRGWIALTRLQTTERDQYETRAAMEQLLARFPSGSRLVSHTTSNDNGKLAAHILVTNEASESLNVSRVKSMMQIDGFSLERDMAANPATGEQNTAGRILLFKGAGKEAVATVYRDDAGRALVVVNSTTRLELAR